ncbi:MAG: hypothetical protein LBI54_08560, partial [Lachnospiraceae bacterium]|nr:hypothetical protein [Lachnospiraceae bacterium]
MKKGDFINMGAVTLAFAVLVFYRLGGLTVPLTSYTATAENPTIILDFGETVALDYFVAYFGPQNFHYDLYGREQDDGEWRLIDEGVLSNEVYKWKGLLRSPQQLRYLRLELVEEAGTLHETLFVDHQGQIIVPVNAAEYPSLFDEQGLFDPYLSKTYYRETVFDETFYARTAYEYIHGLPAYERGHPPLGKSLISVGITLFGMNPFGW